MKTKNEILAEIKFTLIKKHNIDVMDDALINDCVEMTLKAINYTPCSTRLPTDEEIDQAANTLCPVSMGVDDGTYFEGINIGFGMGADFVIEKINELNKAKYQ